MNSTNLGPLLANDPLLQLLIQRLQLTPLEFFGSILNTYVMYMNVDWLCT